MADCVNVKVDSNRTGLSVAEEVCAKQLPTLADDGHDPYWFELEPNSYNDWGGQLTTKARNPINASRQRKKGSVVDLDAAGGFNQDHTQHNDVRLLQGFMFADAREKPTTKPLNGAQLAVTAAVASTHKLTIAAGVLALGFRVGMLVKVYGPGIVEAGNQGVFKVTFIDDTHIGFGSGLTDETFGGEVIVTAVGYSFAAAEVDFVAPATIGTLTMAAPPVKSTGVLTIASGQNAVADETVTIGSVVYTWKVAAAAAYEVTIGANRLGSITNLTATINGNNLLTPDAHPDFVAVDNADGTMTINAKIAGSHFNGTATTETMTQGSWGAVSTASGTGTSFYLFGFTPGEWVFMGGDDSGDHFTNNVGFARIGTISDDELVFDKTTWAVDAESGAGISLELYFGTVIKNEKDADLIKTRYWQFERTLGEDDVGTQAEYLKGAVANELTLNVATADFLKVDFGFIAADVEYRDGTEGLKDGTHYSADGEDAYNSSSDVVRMRMAKIVAGNSFPDAFFAYVTEGKLTIQNNVSPIKAISALGGIDVNVGNFDVGGSLTALFQNVGQNKSLRANDDITVDLIFARQNYGHLWDIPLLALGGGRLDVSENNPITVPLEMYGAENSNDYTLLYNQFDYLPTVAMPAAD